MHGTINIKFYWYDFIRRVSRGGKKYLNPKYRHLAQEYNLVSANYLPPNHYVYSEGKICSKNFTHKTLMENEMNMENMAKMEPT